MTDGKREAISGNYITDNENKPRYFSFLKFIYLAAPGLAGGIFSCGM